MSSFHSPGVGTTVELGELLVPMALGDLLLGAGAANPVLLNIGAANRVLTSVGGTAAWAAALFTDNTTELHPTTVSRGLLVGAATAGAATHVLGADGSKIQRLTTNASAVTITSTGRTTASGISLAETNNAITSATLLNISETGSAVTAARTGSQSSITSNRTTTGATVSDNFDNLLIQRTTTESSGTLTVTGALLKLENIVDANAADTTKMLEIVQDAQSTGDLINAFFGANEVFSVGTTDVIINQGQVAGRLFKVKTDLESDFFTIGAASRIDLLRNNQAGISTERTIDCVEDQSGITGDRTGDPWRFRVARTASAGTRNDDFDAFVIERNHTNMGATAYNSAGSVLRLSNVQTSVDSDTTDLLQLEQDIGSAGTFISFLGTIGVGNPIEAVGAKAFTLTHFAKVKITGGLVRYVQVGTIA